MREESKRERFQALRNKEAQGSLAALEQAELSRMIREMDADESSALQPATNAIRNERLRIQARNAALKALLRRRERLVKRLERVLAASQTERSAIASELERILGESSVGAGAGRR